MDAFDDAAIKSRIARDNPWWREGRAVVPVAAKHRSYFGPFCQLALNRQVKRATILLGPRRVGKTVMAMQLIEKAIEHGTPRDRILYASVDTPVYSGLSLERFMSFAPSDLADGLVIFDEIQYLRDWERHLKDLVDSFPSTKFVASGSAAAALQLKSKESGAGRFTDFMLPPLTFHEFLVFKDVDADLIRETDKGYEVEDIDTLNRWFVKYLNYGGYPEAVLNADIARNTDQFVRNDIIDKVLLKDLPSLYGISSIQDLNRLFAYLAYNAGGEASFEKMAQDSGINKPTMKRYLEYLESAFLIIKLSNVDDTCRSLQRERNFKIYLNNPSMRAALFEPVESDDPRQVGHLAESAFFSQWQHYPSFKSLRYARWRNEGEVDVVFLTGARQKPLWVGEIKWSDRIDRDFVNQTRNMRHMLDQHPTIKSAFITTRTISRTVEMSGRPVDLVPTALQCYTVGRNLTARLADTILTATEPARTEAEPMLNFE